MRMLLKVEEYDFIVKYITRQTVPIAYCLLQVSPRPSKHIEEIDFNVLSMIILIFHQPE